jgi:uncharacterized membrane-anchored protein
MQTRNVPALGARYWAAISLASVFGANMGDFVSRNLGLGHLHGLAPLALVFAAILLLERRARIATEAYYWLAIVTLRTAATNLADLATHDLRLDYDAVTGGLAGLLVLILLVDRWRRARAAAARPGAAPPGLPATDAYYWAAMLTAGTLGTAVGDDVADTLGLGPATLVTVALLGLALALGAHAALLATQPGYWTAIVIVRTAGTNVGDFVAGRHGLGLGLPVSTPLTGLLLLAVLLLWRPRRAAPDPERDHAPIVRS